MNTLGMIKLKTNDLKKEIKRAINLIGGLSRFVGKNEVVLIKPNFNTADPYPASSDLEFIKAVIDLVYEQKPKMVVLGESSTMTLNTRKVMEKLNVFDLEKREPPVRIYVFEEREWIKKRVKSGKYLRFVSVPDILERVDKVILVPCLKTHCYAQYSGALKLSVGFMRPRERVRLHLRHLQEKISELNTIIHPSLIIMDARKCFISGGPNKGELREPGFVLVGKDRVAIDVEGVKIIQSFPGNSLGKINPWDLKQIQYASVLGLGAKGENDYLVKKE